jgi:hypothetical protein
MDALIMTSLMAALTAAVVLWLYVRTHGRAHAWGRLAARCKANADAAALRESADARYCAEWAPVAGEERQHV